MLKPHALILAILLLVANVKVCGFISDHELISYLAALPTPSTKPKNTVSDWRYHRIDVDVFRTEFIFVQLPASSVSKLYNQYVHDLGDLLDSHTALVSRFQETILEHDEKNCIKYS